VDPKFEATQWKPGQSGNPAGRPKGSRNKLEETFLADLLAAWEKGGKDYIVAAAAKDPLGIVKVVASLMPSKVEPTNPLQDVTREQLRAALAALDSFIATNGADAPIGSPEQSEQAGKLQTLQ
jgi:hypothetical protein